MSNQGYIDIDEVASKIKYRISTPDLIYSSPAIRAFSTASKFIEIMGKPNSLIIKENKLYDDAYRTVLSMVNKLDNNCNSVMFISHNPDIYSLVTFLSGERVMDVPTCSVFCIDFDTNDWKNIKNMNGKIRFFETPESKK